DPSTSSPQALMLQSLLEDRFRLKVHHETRELPVYELVIAKGGSKIKLSEDQGPTQPPTTVPQRGQPMPRGAMRMARGDFEGTGVQFANFVAALSQQLGGTVVDRTGLKGRYDIKLVWTPDPPVGGPGLGRLAGLGDEAARPVDPS